MCPEKANTPKQEYKYCWQSREDGMESGTKTWGRATNGLGASFAYGDHVLKPIVVMVVQLRGHTKNDWAVTLSGWKL